MTHPEMFFNKHSASESNSCLIVKEAAMKNGWEKVLRIAKDSLLKHGQ